MNVNNSLNQLRKVFFSPLDVRRIEQTREQHERRLQELNVMNLR